MHHPPHSLLVISSAQILRTPEMPRSAAPRHLSSLAAYSRQIKQCLAALLPPLSRAPAYSASALRRRSRNSPSVPTPASHIRATTSSSSHHRPRAATPHSSPSTTSVSRVSTSRTLPQLRNSLPSTDNRSC